MVYSFCLLPDAVVNTTCCKFTHLMLGSWNADYPNHPWVYVYECYRYIHIHMHIYIYIFIFTLVCVGDASYVSAIPELFHIFDVVILYIYVSSKENWIEGSVGHSDENQFIRLVNTSCWVYELRLDGTRSRGS